MKSIKMLGLAALAALTAMAFVGASSAMASDPTALCKKDPGTGAHEVCPANELVTHVHESTLEGKLAVLLGAIEIKCDVLILGDVSTSGLLSLKGKLDEGGVQLWEKLAISGHFTYTNCTRENGKACEVKETSANAFIGILKLAHELADVSYEYDINIHCGIFINCTYNGEELLGHSLGPLLTGDKEDGKGEPNGEVRLEQQQTHRVSGFCPETAELDLLTTPLEKTYITE